MQDLVLQIVEKCSADLEGFGYRVGFLWYKWLPYNQNLPGHFSTICRTKSCIFGNETCPVDDDEDLQDVYGLKHEPFCNGPMIKVCPLAGSDFGDFKQFDIGGESRSLRYFTLCQIIEK